MKPSDLLFVYGSLRHGEASDLSLKPGCSFVGEDSIFGELYSVGWYPGVKLVDDIEGSLVHGDVFRLDDEALISWLDSYEGYPDLFSRQKVLTVSGDVAWIYTYQHGVDSNKRVISGDWSQRRDNNDFVIEDNSMETVQ